MKQQTTPSPAQEQFSVYDQVLKARAAASKYIEEAKRKYLDAMTTHTEWVKNVNAYGDILLQLESALNTVGLTIKQVDIPYYEQKFCLNISAVRKGGKFRFLTRSHTFTKQGRSSNHKQREAKVIKLQAAIDQAMQSSPHSVCRWFNKVLINQFSIEIDRWSDQDEDSKHVLITAYFERPQL